MINFPALCDAFLKENRKINLSSVRDADGVRERHIDDSLRAEIFFSDIPDDSKIIDAGTGGGFPGLALAARFPHLNFFLIDTISKKCDAVTRIAATCGIKNIKTVHSRLENYPENSADLVTARALAPLPVTLELCSFLIKNNGKIIIFASKDQQKIAKTINISIQNNLGLKIKVQNNFIIATKFKTIKKRRTESEIRKKPLFNISQIYAAA